MPLEALSQLSYGPEFPGRAWGSGRTASSAVPLYSRVIPRLQEQFDIPADLPVCALRLPCCPRCRRRSGRQRCRRLPLLLPGRCRPLRRCRLRSRRRRSGCPSPSPRPRPRRARRARYGGRGGFELGVFLFHRSAGCNRLRPPAHGDGLERRAAFRADDGVFAEVVELRAAALGIGAWCRVPVSPREGAFQGKSRRPVSRAHGDCQMPIR